MFGFGKKKREQLQELGTWERQARIELARAIAEDGLTGERKRKTLAKIAEAEKRGK